MAGRHIGSAGRRWLTIFVAALFVSGAVERSLAAGQLGAIRDAARRAQEEARKAAEAKRQADEEAAKKNQPAAAPETTAPPAAVAPAATTTPATTAPATTAPAAAATTSPTFQSFSKFDFVPGEKIVAFEDFTQDAIGDFPAKWNTDASGEIVTIAGKPGRWLKLTRAGFFTPEFITELPENVTVEFDLAVPPTFGGGFPLEAALVQLADPKKPDDWQVGPNSVLITSHPFESDGVSTITPRQDGTSSRPNSTRTPQLTVTRVAPVHVAIWRQRQRVRVYLNEEKVWDIPRAVADAAKLNALVFFVRGGCNNCEYYLANVRVATGAADTRNKIMTEGKWVTHGILFDVNSDRVRAESYGSLKEIAGVLAENADLRVQIVGHTDADGDDAANLDLSKRRAAAVKTVLATEFKIDSARMDTDGKGESQPVDRNDSAAGKANNRRVEFIKR